jgi:hypothetical protein
VAAACGKTTITISGYGAAKPLGRASTISINGQRLQGSSLAQLLADLAHRRAAYRLEILCSDPTEITLRVHEGEKQVDGTVRFRSGTAFIRRARLESYTGLREADADSFWYR